MKPGTRVVSHLWDMGEWEPDATFRVARKRSVPLDRPGTGRGSLDARRPTTDRWQGELDIAQQFQRVGGTLTIRGKTQPLLGAYVQGATLGFTFVDLDGGVRSVRARVDGAALSGSLQFSGNLTPIAGRRR